MRIAGAVWCENLLLELRAAAMVLRKSPGFSAAVVIMFAVGIGSSTAFFTVLNDVLWRRPPGLATTEGLYVLSRVDKESQDGFTHLGYLAYAARLRSFSDLLAYRGAKLVLRDGGTPIRLDVAFVTGGFFRTLGLHIAPGRDFRPEEHRTPGSHPVAIVSHRLWQGRFQGDPAMVGRTISLSGIVLTVVGVAPPGFGSLELGWGDVTDVWMPLMMEGAFKLHFPVLNSDFFSSLTVIGRLRVAHRRAAAEAELAAVSARIEKPDAKTGQRKRVVLSPHLWCWRSSDRSEAYAIGGLLIAFAALVLAVGCANAANLQLARTASRRSEIAVRLALGASRGRLMLLLLGEILLLALVSAVPGLALAWGLAVWFWQLAFPIVQPRIDGNVVGFVLALVALVALASGFVPAWRATGGDVAADLKAGAGRATRARTKLQTALLLGQVAGSLVLLHAAALFVRTVRNLEAIDLGFDPTNLLVIGIEFGTTEHPDERIRLIRRELAKRLATQPGVESVTRTAVLPRSGNFFWGTRQVLPDDGNAPVQAGVVAERNEVAPDYFATLRVRLRRGREFDDRDRADTPGVVMVNESLARRLWPKADALGRRVRVPGWFDNPTYEIVGVVPDLRVFFREERAPPQLYYALDQQRTTDGTILARVAPGALSTVAAAVPRILREVDPELPTPRVESFAAWNVRAHSGERMYAVLGSCFAGVALVLAAFGVGSLLMYGVAQRTREVGVRLALGASRRDVMALVIRDGMSVVLVGAGLGVLAAVSATRLIASHLYGVTPFDAVSAGVSALLVVLVALPACWLPARRAARVDPLVALRCE